MKAYKAGNESLFWLTDGVGHDLVRASSQGELELKMAAFGMRLSGGWRQFLSLRADPSAVVWAADVEEERG